MNIHKVIHNIYIYTPNYPYTSVHINCWLSIYLWCRFFPLVGNPRLVSSCQGFNITRRGSPTSRNLFFSSEMASLGCTPMSVKANTVKSLICPFAGQFIYIIFIWFSYIPCIFPIYPHGKALDLILLAISRPGTVCTVAESQELAFAVPKSSAVSESPEASAMGIGCEEFIAGG